MPSEKPKKPKKIEPDDPEQSKRFEETARELGVDESGKEFDRAIGVVVPGSRMPEKSGSNK